MVEAVAEVQTRVCSQHSKPLEVFCQTDGKCVCVCVACITDEHKGHDVVSPARAQERLQMLMESSLKSEISKREAELNKLTENVEPLKSSAQAAVEHSDRVFTELQAFIEPCRGGGDDQNSEGGGAESGRAAAGGAQCAEEESS
ncbi:hypothetical protein AALO_G00123550 [Alosa alosa]|uniref:B box-type domain-containing protein n=1 Tax=Alosa alosa TaxID=278164 RepID=A0AAV6GKQ8_9TELE|nr:hypothetical protein AALO_G00123550 [Alosa alosa]